MKRSRFLVAYASKHGSTEEVAQEVATTLRRGGSIVYVRDAESVSDVSEFDAVVLGGSIYMGRLHKDARRFLELHREALARVPLAVFALGPQSMEKEADSREQLQHALDQTRVAPDKMAIFGGVIDPAKLRFPLNHLAKRDERDWPAIERWAMEILQLVEREPASIT